MLLSLKFQWNTLPLLLIIVIQHAAAMILAERIEPRSNAPAPISVTPSQDWDGNDGPWSSFAVQIGNPPQSVKLLISTKLAQTWAVAPEGCGSGDPTNCAQLRGGEYIYDTSSTWVPNLANDSTQIYYLTLESNLGYDGLGRYGFDDITLGFQGGGEVTLKNQTVAGIATKEYYMGLFGLSPSATNFSSSGASVPSFMENLRSQGKIPSLSWGYTAGNQYISGLDRVLGSLTLGGYDSSRFTPTDFSIPFAPDFDKDLAVKIDNISLDEDLTLLESPITAFLDSSIPYIYLPAPVCALFESAFGLTWDETAQLYLVNTTQHILLQTQNPNVTFTLGSDSSNSKVNITLPYAAFDLTASTPLVDGTANYFPLKQANGSTQYTLGRTFFQEAYIIADFERKTFSVSQCKWVEAPQNIVTIYPPANSTLGPAFSTSLPKEKVQIIAGIATGAFLAILCAFLAWLYWLRHQRIVLKITHPPTPREMQELYNKPELECSPAGKIATICEVESGKVERVAEVDGRTWRREMPAREEVAAEMDAKTKPVEIGGREQRWSWTRGDSRASRFRFGGKRDGGECEKGEKGEGEKESEMSDGSLECEGCEECEKSEGNVVGPAEGEETMSSLSSGMGSLANWNVGPDGFVPAMGNLEDYIVSPQVASREVPERRMENLGDYTVSPHVENAENQERRAGNLEDYIVSPQVASPESPDLRMNGFGNRF